MASKDSDNQLFSYEDLQRIIKKIPEPMVISKITEDGSIQVIECNDLIEEKSGYSLEELQRMSPDQFMTENSVEDIDKYLKELQIHGYTQLEAMNLSKDGSTFPMKLTLGRVEGDQQTYVIALLRDITDLRETEALLALSNNQLESLIEHNPDLIFTLDKEGNFTNVNPVHEQVLHYSQEELLSTPFINFVVEEDIPLVIEKYELVLNKKTVRFDIRLRNKQGNILHFDITVIPIIRNKETDGMFCIFQDRTEEKQTKRKLDENEQMYRSLFENNIDAIFTIDLNGTFLQMNEAAEQLLGYSLNEVKVLDPLTIIKPENQETTIASFTQVIKGDAAQFETTIVNRDKDQRYLHITMIPIKIEGEITGIHCIAKDMTEKHDLEQKLNYMVFHDYLTGLSNSHQFNFDLKELVNKEKAEPFSLFFLDLDRFKAINDSFGHAYGDQLLKKVARRLLSIVPDMATVYRFGGDEFIIILRKSTTKDAKLLSEQIIDTISEPYQIEQLEIVTTPSIGISRYPLDGEDTETLVRKADNAMYHVKRITRGHYQFYNESFKQDNKKNIKMDALLRKALRQNEFFLVYQPQIDAKSNKIAGAEALIRWQSEELGLIPPLDFIPLAEETGFIIPLGEWVIREACCQIQSWREQGIVLPIAINLSIRQFHYKDFIPSLRKILKETKVDPSLLHMEITESMAIDQEIATDVLKQLKVLGVKIAIDDFGTGYSSLSYLKKFPFDFLKIDRSFIRDIENDGERKMISIINMLAKNFNMQTIAEGVETDKHAKLLRDDNCDTMQGYFYSQPLAPRAFVQWMKNWESDLNKAEE